MSAFIGPALARVVSASLDERDALDDDGKMGNFKLQEQTAEFNDAERAAADAQKQENDAAQAVLKDLVG